MVGKPVYSRQSVSLPHIASGNAYNESERCVCAGYDNGDVKLFDLRTMSLQWETNVKNGVSTSLCVSVDQLCCILLQVCSVEFDRKDIPMNKMVVTTLESKFSLFDMRTQHPTKGFASLTEKVRSKVTYSCDDLYRFTNYSPARTVHFDFGKQNHTMQIYFQLCIYIALSNCE